MTHIFSYIDNSLNKIRLNISGSKSLIQLIVFSFILLESVLMIYSFFPNIGEASALNTDFMFHMNRFYGISQALDFGTFPFYINTHYLNGYGYGVNLFYPDLAMLPFAFLIKPFGLAFAYKMMVFTYTFFCGVFSFYTIRKITKDNLAAFIFVILYNFALYKVVDFAYRGATAEFLAFTFVPLIFNGLYEIIEGDYKKRWYIITLGFFCLINTHIISSLIMFVVVCIFILIYFRKIIYTPSRLVYLCIAGIVSFLLSCSIILTITEQLYSNSFYLTEYPIVSEMLTSTPKNIINGLFKGLDGSSLTHTTLGLIITLSFFTRLCIKRSSAILKFADICLMTGLILLFCTSNLLPWNTLPLSLLDSIQFTYRFLLPISFILALSGAIYLTSIARKYNKYYSVLSLFIILTIFAIISNGNVLRDNDKNVITNNADTLYDIDIIDIVGGEYLPAKIPYPTSKSKYGNYYHRMTYILDRGDSISYNKQTAQIHNVERQNQFYNYKIDINKATTCILPLIYYKGYKATINNEIIDVKESNDGLVEITIPRSGNISVWYNGTILQRISYIISICTLVILTIYIYYVRRKKSSIKNNSLGKNLA